MIALPLAADNKIAALPIVKPPPRAFTTKVTLLVVDDIADIDVIAGFAPASFNVIAPVTATAGVPRNVKGKTK